MDLLYLPSEDTQDLGYSNLLKEVQQRGWFGSVTFSNKIYTPERYKHKIDRTPKDVWKSVLDSDRVQWIMSNIAREEDRDKENILKEASKILQEMAFTEHLNMVRFFGFSMYHIMNALYHDGVHYNTDTLKAIRESVREHPVILMPSHRCYMDFLVASTLCVHLGLPLPAIASGMDFMAMKGIVFLLRSSGAFFMRRSFGSDKLYWALFTEYVHSLIINSDRTIEFFIEGTRSRSGKSLNPKLGLFSVVAEPYLKAQIYDIMIVPVSISYDRILEESLYAYELLGVPKPKESTSGLFKATSILQENYGSLHVHLGEPISIRQECSHMDRAIHACYPRYMLRLTVKEQSYLTDLAYKVVQIQQKNMVISLWALIATVVSQSPTGIPFKSLVDDVQWLLDLLRRCDVRVRVRSGNLADVAKHVLFQYNHLVQVDTKDAEDGNVSVRQSGKTYGSLSRTNPITVLPGPVRDKAAIHLMIASYRNQLIHVFVKPALVTSAILAKHVLLCKKEGQFVIDSKEIKDNFAFLREIFYKEFIFAPNQLAQDFEEGIEFLCHAGAFKRDGNTLHFHTRGMKLISFLVNLMRPFFQCYMSICDYTSQHHHACEIKELGNAVQLWMAEVIEEISLLETLSKDLISNGFHGIAKMGALVIRKESGSDIVHVKRMQARTLRDRIQSLMESRVYVESPPQEIGSKL